MDTLTTLGRTLGFSFAAGINLYATVAILGLASRYAWVDLPPEYQTFNNPWVIGIALVLYALEFVADKIPWLDSLWDAVHTVIRPLGGAFIAVTQPRTCVPERAGRRGAHRRHHGGEQPFHEGRHASARQQQPRAVLELGAEHRRRHVRAWSRLSRAAASDRRADRQSAIGHGDPRLGHVAREDRETTVCEGEGGGLAAGQRSSGSRRTAQGLRHRSNDSGVPLAKRHACGTIASSGLLH